MNYQNILKKQTSIILMSVIFMVLIIIGVSYSLFMQVNESTDIQVLESGTLVLSTTKGTTITTANLPQTDIEGLSSDGYTFSIKNNGSLGYLYNLYISNVASDNKLEYEYIKISLDDGEPITLSELNFDESNNSRYIILQDNYVAPANQYGDVVTHTIKVWIDEDAPKSIIGKKILLQIDMSGEVGQKIYQDKSGAHYPELYDGLIPITYDDENNIIIADLYSDWYNYSEHRWANVMLIDQSNPTIKNKYINIDGSFKTGMTVNVDDILQMYVWIPRYRYKLFNANISTSVNEMIEIEFEDVLTDKSEGSSNGEWLTHPAFTFGNTELSGIWVGKFETSGTTDNLTIIPNVDSLAGININTMFNASRAIETINIFGLTSSQVDTHMMKNIEWGVVAYLTNSKYGRYYENGSCIDSGCEVWVNNFSTTGCAGDSVSESTSTSCNAWNTSVGVNASTTGNLYGIYDMSGGTWEYIMGVLADESGLFNYKDSGFTSIPDSKYYDFYPCATFNLSCSMLGDGIGETNGWYNDYGSNPSQTYPWLARGGQRGNADLAGIFGRWAYKGSQGVIGFRVVLTAE